jgi:hypothetical protein
MTAGDPGEPLLEKLTPEARPLMEELRGVVKQALPQLNESVHLGWGVIHYRAGPKMRDVVVALDPQRAWVNLAFADGVDLVDPTGRLEGSGKRLRHVKVRTNEEAHSSELRALLEQAGKLRGV